MRLVQRNEKNLREQTGMEIVGATGPRTRDTKDEVVEMMHAVRLL
jgi:hypothetical protein